jgi:hypothetical protein
VLTKYGGNAASLLGGNKVDEIIDQQSKAKYKLNGS